MRRSAIAGAALAAMTLPALALTGPMLAGMRSNDPAPTPGVCGTSVAFGPGVSAAAGFDTTQLANAAAIITAGRAMNIDPRGQTIAVAVADEESNLYRRANTNVPESMALPHEKEGSNGTSVGLFQQLNSWGTAGQRLDATWSAQQFYTALLQVPGWKTLPLTTAAQAVQRSAFPSAYAPFEAPATQLVSNTSRTNNIVTAACTSSAPGAQQALVTAPGAVGTAERFAQAQIGKPYIWGGTGPEGYDCSGLVQAAYAAAGIVLPRTTYEQAQVGVPVAQADLQPGDLVFPDASHVTLYIGNGMQIEAQHTGVPILLDRVWGFMAARRVVGAQ